MSVAFPPALTWLIDNPARALLVSPQDIVDRLAPKPTDHILEIGPGSGYFSVALALNVPKGHLEVLDIQPPMLNKVRERMAAEKVANVGYTTADASRPLPFPPARFDSIVMVAVLGEVPDARKALAGAAGVIRKGGTLLVHEHLPDPDFIRESTLLELAGAAGFRHRATTGSSWNYTAVFERIP